MKKFLCKILALLLGVGSLLWAGGQLYKNSVGYQNIDRTEGTDTFSFMPDSIDVAVFGSSHARTSFRAFPADVTGFNFGLSSQTPQYDARMLAEYGDRLHEGSTVILTVSYLSPYWTDSLEDFAIKQPRYYRVLPPWRIVDADWGQALLGRFSPLLTTEFSSVLSALEETELSPTYDENGMERQLSPEELEPEQKRIGKDHLSVITPAFPDGNPVMLEAYREMLAKCAENGWNAVLVTPPYPTAYNTVFVDANLTPDFYSAFYNLVTVLSEEFDVPYLDYSHDPRFTERLELFKNIDHLNAAGESAFRAIFWSDPAAAGLRAL